MFASHSVPAIPGFCVFVSKSASLAVTSTMAPKAGSRSLALEDKEDPSQTVSVSVS